MRLSYPDLVWENFMDGIGWKAGIHTPRQEAGFPKEKKNMPFLMDDDEYVSMHRKLGDVESDITLINWMKKIEICWLNLVLSRKNEEELTAQKWHLEEWWLQGEAWQRIWDWKREPEGLQVSLTMMTVTLFLAKNTISSIEDGEEDTGGRSTIRLWNGTCTQVHVYTLYHHVEGVWTRHDTMNVGRLRFQVVAHSCTTPKQYNHVINIRERARYLEIVDKHTIQETLPTATHHNIIQYTSGIGNSFQTIPCHIQHLGGNITDMDMPDTWDN
jgi:hypothetical protein